MDKFRSLGLSQGTLKALEEIKFSIPSEIQEKTIPLAIAGKDVIGKSSTGSGKTLAFGAPIIEKVKPKRGLQALILTPTRELAEQISKALKTFSKYNPLKIITVYGGTSIEKQIRELPHAEVVVATPGRALDHLKRRTIDLSKIKILVLDEADRMLDMGFIHDVTEIVHHCPKQRQTLLFSATLSEDIMHISRKYMQQPKEVSAKENVDPTKLEHVFYDVPSNQKFSLLVHLLKKESSNLVMIFCNTKRNVDLIAKNLQSQGFEAIALHGDLNQAKRNRVLENFHKSSRVILVCTDVAARGLDIKGVSHVYNYESPKTTTEYIHRVGRTARAGKEGKAITIIADRDYENFRRVMDTDLIKIKNLPLPDFGRVFVNMNDEGRERQSGYRGRPQRQNRYSDRRDNSGNRDYPKKSNSSPRREDRPSGRRDGSRGRRDNDSRGRKNSSPRRYNNSGRNNSGNRRNNNQNNNSARPRGRSFGRNQRR